MTVCCPAAYVAWPFSLDRRARVMGSDTPDKKDAEKPVAVALKYEGKAEHAPRVTAKGHGTIAEQIIKVAESQGVEVHEDADLAQLLVTLDVDSFIPVEAFAAVAEILGYVYRKNSGAAAPRRGHEPTE